ncbi:MAG: glycosyltransferase family 39 protein [Acidobacteria bacterium]|nr:glycosyltransferase family 39 protein [Acidobacteriota bacterium]
MNHQAPINLRDLFREDRKALIALALFFIANLAGTWQRWTQPLISQGREVSTPARIINGEKLYTDIQSVFGPFAPYFNAALYKVFGIDLIVLKISGALCAIIILVTIFWISRRLMSVWKSTAATAAVIVICALKSTANYIQPYSFAALYCLVFSLAAMAFLLAYLQTGKKRNFLWVGLFLGLSATAKLDSALVVLVTIIAVLLLDVMEHRRLPLQEFLYLSVSALAIVCPIYGYIMLTTPLSVLLKNNYIFLFNIPSQVLHFNSILSGLAKWPTSFWFSLSGVAMPMIWAGTGALLGALISHRKGDQWRELLGIGRSCWPAD